MRWLRHLISMPPLVEDLYASLVKCSGHVSMGRGPEIDPRTRIAPETLDEVAGEKGNLSVAYDSDVLFNL